MVERKASVKDVAATDAGLLTFNGSISVQHIRQLPLTRAAIDGDDGMLLLLLMLLLDPVMLKH